jgi:hypothetical protein
MNTPEMSALPGDSAAPQPPLYPPEASVVPPATGGKPRRRRWWIYALVAFSGLVCLGLVGVIGVVTYWHSLIRNYTTTQPKVLPAFEATKQDSDDVVRRFFEFIAATKEGRAPGAFRITADDLNTVISQNKDTAGKLFVHITQRQLLGDFSFPADKSGKKKELRGRYVNGQALFKLNLKDGFLELHVAQFKVNGRDIPKWLFNKFKDRNLLDKLESNYEFLQFLQELESVEILDDAIVLTPVQTTK